ncbi:senescence associated gene 20-like [Oryza brachyantha]|uniref:senescence associated gene 20-like n=1 Tax=Oryza brachyantha TaxID=4533 RepID=UPI001AD9C609|nr:senescence associated gene 20-like [Oryza brachyantha]
MAMELGEAAERNERLVESLYAAVAAGDGAAAEAVLADDVEWWFHGPRRCEHMRRRLAGEDQAAAFVFVPRRVAAVGRGGGWVVAEGWEGPRAYWVHAWAVEGGRITRLREYFNTSVTVRDVGDHAHAHGHCQPQLELGGGGGGGGGHRRAAGASAAVCWQSQRGCGGADDGADRSLPGLVLAI